ncbi:hypothetical protein EH223_06205 [candidate division KSB1 bacterium]|nr:hypothetical protein [candidate division KSB1 bacterium]RQW05032.1 MAG: hypothetical protein EH223_06205 [candidate division KSB1 bacterium]
MSSKNVIFTLVILFVGYCSAQTGFENRPITNNVAMPTAHTLNKGEFQIGLGPLAFGVSDKIQIGSNVLTFLLGSPNANARVKLLDNSIHNVAAGVGVGQTRTKLYGQDATYISWYPFIAYSRPLSPTTQFHASLNLSAFMGDDGVQDAEPQDFWRGTSADAGVEYSYSNRTKFLLDGGYDFTFRGARVGGAVLWGWKTFRLKLGVAYYNPKGRTNAFISPILGFWWRFGGRD